MLKEVSGEEEKGESCVEFYSHIADPALLTSQSFIVYLDSWLASLPNTSQLPKPN